MSPPSSRLGVLTAIVLWTIASPANAGPRQDAALNHVAKVSVTSQTKGHVSDVQAILAPMTYAMLLAGFLVMESMSRRRQATHFLGEAFHSGKST
ncbi:MAG: hypothetical protein V4532_16750 [Pseudomonadota bacterium]